MKRIDKESLMKIELEKEKGNKEKVEKFILSLREEEQGVVEKKFLQKLFVENIKQ